MNKEILEALRRIADALEKIHEDLYIISIKNTPMEGRLAPH